MNNAPTGTNSNLAFVLYYVFKLTPMLIGGMAIVLGYRLFILGVTGQASLSVDAKTVSAQLLNAAPGLFFAIGGIVANIFAVWKSVQVNFQGGGGITFEGSSEAIWKGFSDARVEEHLVSKIQSPKLKKLVDENKIQEAIAEADNFYVKDTAERQQKISLLLLSSDEKDWNTALAMLDEDEGLQRPEYFVTLAFRFWSVKQVEIAISLAERGMQRTNDEKLLARFRNSLAYYYADAGVAGKEALAREFAESAVKARPNDAGPLDTLGFVKISYAKTKEEISEGVKLCTLAYERGSRFELYAKNIEKASIRMKQFPAN